MRIVIKVLLVAIIFAFAGAKAEDKISILFCGGTSIPSGPETFTDGWNPGYSIGGGLIMHMGETSSLITRINYSSFPVDSDKLKSEYFDIYGESLTIEGGSINSLEFFIESRMNPRGYESKKLWPYLSGGFGVTYLTFSKMTLTSETETGEITGDDPVIKPMISFGFGLGFSFSNKVKGYIDSHYTILQTNVNGTYHLPIQAGISFKLGKDEE